MIRLSPLRAFCVVAIFLLPSLKLAAEANPDRVQFNHDIRIEANDNVGDVTCIFCSVHVRGHVSGDVTAIAGSVFAEQGASIAGDVTAVGGSARVENDAQLAGDLTTIGGTLHRDPQATVAGDITTIGGAGGGWIFLIFLLPFLFLGGIIALIIWLIQRSRHPAPVPPYTLHRN
ncbi:MAG: hypothetical protein ACRD23_16120 [Terriglobales bacterium]